MLPIPPPRVDSSKGPNRVIRAQWSTKENSKKIVVFRIFPIDGKITQMAPTGTLAAFFLLIQTLPTFWAEQI